MNTLIYIGIAVNLIGAILLLMYSIKYYNAFKDSERMPARKAELKADWAKKRLISFGMMIGGLLIAIVACYL